MANISKINFKGVEYNIKPLMDTEPTANSTNAVQSGGVKSALDGLQAEIPTVDANPTQGSNNAVSSGGVYSALQAVEAQIPQIDSTLTQSGQAADAKVTGDKITGLKEDIIQTAGVVEEIECGLTDEVKTALLACFTRVAWIGDDGQTYYDALSDALNRSRVISSISAVFTQGSAAIYDTDELYALKQYLAVTATYSDGTAKEVNNYTLSGKLVAGTSTITVAYNKKTTTFSVNVTHQEKTLESISATFNSSASITTDNELDDLRPYLTVRATYSDGSTNTITNYTLSGSLNVGANTITVTYNNKTSTFTVNVTQAEKTLQSITAVFNQGSAVIYTDSSLNDLKPYLTVTARYSDNTTQIVTSYTLSGTLTAGTSIITAIYGDKTATFEVTVTGEQTGPLYSWDFTQSLVDSVSGKTATTNATRNSNGVTFNASEQYIDFDLAFSRDRTYEIDITTIDTKVGSATYRRVFAFGENGTVTASSTAALVFGRSTGGQSGWWWYLGSSWDTSPINAANYSSFNGKTLKIYIDSTGKCHSYTKAIGADDSTYVSIGSSTNATTSYTNGKVYMGSSAVDSLANATIKAFRVYEGEK